ncbi:MAG: hypothetical protein ACOX2K_06695 [Bacillota bacterium]
MFFRCRLNTVPRQDEACWEQLADASIVLVVLLALVVYGVNDQTGSSRLAGLGGKGFWHER